MSVVTPTYENASFLPECIESVLAQTYENWEYVIADDASGDDTGSIARSYAEKDERIRVREHTERLGVPANWNRALGYLSPESVYTKVVHADDWIFPECIERMVAVAEEHPSVTLVGAPRLDDGRVNLEGLPVGRSVFTGAEVTRLTLLGDLYVFGSPTSTLIRTSAIRARQPFYDESTLHADSEVCFALLEEGDFGYVPEVLTATRRHERAVTSYAAWLGTYRPSQIAMHRRYGRGHLSRDEYDRRLAYLVFDYVRFVARRPGRLRDERFRAYHRQVARDLASGVRASELLHGTTVQIRRMLARRRGAAR